MNNHNGNHHGIVFCGCADSREERSPLDGVQSKTTVIFCTIYVNTTYVRTLAKAHALGRLNSFLSVTILNGTQPYHRSLRLTSPSLHTFSLISSRLDNNSVVEFTSRAGDPLRSHRRASFSSRFSFSARGLLS